MVEERDSLPERLVGAQEPKHLFLAVSVRKCKFYQTVGDPDYSRQALALPRDRRPAPAVLEARVGGNQGDIGAANAAEQGQILTKIN
jgi:hypothetical protein